ncbi:DHHA1 domain containing protein [Trema orientale]|uniref:DHHA1 domain containing protein n=1 Tax=Trema orientale TaxID=63057 RepID=A0A2P5CS12_TREOI|nr:DHHA1 domain containing protein [Trema orientale]
MNFVSKIRVYKLSTDRIYATYFGGDEKAGLAPDNEARDIWLQFLPPGRVLPFGCKKPVKIAHKKIAEQNLKKAIEVTTMFAEIAVSEGKAFCICSVDVGLDASAVREVVSQVIRDEGISAMVFSTDETTNKAVVCAGVPENEVERQLDVTDWLTAALEPLNGRFGRGRGGLATGQGTDASQVQEAMTLAASFALVKLE